jgi:malonyl-CoA decarboxylase
MTRNLLNSKKAVKEFFESGKEASLSALVRDYYSLSEGEKRQFLAMISRYSFSYDDFCTLANLFVKEEGPASNWQERLRTLRVSLISPRERFFKSFVNIRGGLKFLLDLRGDLLRLGKTMEGIDWRETDQDIVFLLDMWFLEGFLFISEVGLDTSYQEISFIKEHDMVHPMTSVEEMVKRLGKDRLCYGLYHVLLPHEPMIFIEVALADRITGSITEIMENNKPIERPDTAIFYSINNTQQGLSGLGLGKTLIAGVVEGIRGKYPHIKNFSTLSPIPGLWKKYMEPLLKRESIFKMKPEMIERYFPEKGKEIILSHYRAGGGKEKDFLEVLHQILSDTKWIEDKIYLKHLADPLKRIVYFYLTEEKNDRDKPLDPVANFHIENGASLSLNHVRFMANTYEYGVQDSLSFMVNYIYQSRWLEHVKETLPALMGKIKSVFPSKKV